MDNPTYTVYLSLHPADRYLYLDALADRLQAEGCAVRYAPSPADSDTVNWGGVDLVVLGVTEKYITWNNSGFVSEALAALGQNVPILPIMLEEGIANLFNTRCKKLHYIENTDGALSEETLAAVIAHLRRLWGDHPHADEENKPKIFISYRKKDRGELQRLVGLLDAHPLRDRVTLWYDAGLQPGENYSTTIAQQIRSADLFLLLVTPHMLEEGNYVARVEYPAAKTAKRPILPIVMQPTDRSLLPARFPDLPKGITDKQIGGIFAKLKL